MFSPSDYNDAVPQFTNGNYANTPLNPLYVEEPSALDYNRGMEPVQTLPAQWWNWLCNQFTAKLNKLNIYVKNIFDELAQLLSFVGVTPDATESEITVGQLKDMFQNKYPTTLTDKIPLSDMILGAIYNNLLGLYWKKATTPSTSAPDLYEGAKYANGLWVWGGTQGPLWSEDGKTWNKGSITTNTRAVIYANNLWVCSVYNGGMHWSEDGKNWTQGTVIQTAYRIVFENNLFFAFNPFPGWGASSIGLWWSEDGKDWTQVSSLSSENIHIVSYYNNLFVCSTQNSLWWSEDGKNWTQGTGPTSYAENIIYYRNLWVCGTNAQGVWWSSDGKTWTQATGITSTARVTTLLIKDHGTNMINLCVCGTYAHGAWWSNDGKSWTQATGLSTTTRITNMVFALNMLVCSNNEQSVSWSFDGKTWTQATGLSSGITVAELFFANGIWLAHTGQSGTGIYRSIDGINWYKSLHFGSNGQYFAYSNGVFLVSFAANGLWYSSVTDLLENKWVDLGNIPIASN